MVVLAVGVTTLLFSAVVVAVVVVILRHKVATPTDMSTVTRRSPVEVLGADDGALSALFAHLSRSLNACSTSRDQITWSGAAHSAAMLNADQSTCRGSLDRSVASAPAACQVIVFIVVGKFL